MKGYFYFCPALYNMSGICLRKKGSLIACHLSPACKDSWYPWTFSTAMSTSIFYQEALCHLLNSTGRQYPWCFHNTWCSVFLREAKQEIHLLPSQERRKSHHLLLHVCSPRPSTMGCHCLACDWDSDPTATPDHWVSSPAWQGSEL